MDHALTAIGAILAAIVGLAIVAVLVSKNSNTSGVLQAGGTALSQVISAAIAPVSATGSNVL